MRLTNYKRSAFVRAVLDDIPNPYISAEEMQEFLYKKMSPEVREVCKTNPAVHKGIIKFSHFDGQKYHTLLLGDVRHEDAISHANIRRREIDKLASELRAIAAGCSTLKQLQEALPKLVKYMSEAPPKATPNLPVVSGVVDRLKELGFPKGQ